MPSFPTNDSNGAILGKVGEWLSTTFAPALVEGKAPVRESELVVNVKDFGATGDGVTDDTAAIQAAWDHVNLNARRLFFPEGNYLYNGPGLSGPHPNIHGAGREKTKITLGASSRLFDTSVGLGTVDIGDFTVIGGIGLFRTTRTSNSVAGIYKIENIVFSGYTGAAIENNSVDMPYWKFRDLAFDAGNMTSTIGIALSGLTDGVEIANCEFLRNRIHVKMRYGGNNAYIHNCDFIRFGASQGQPRADVWIVPRNQTTNAGPGFVLTECKFGPENMHADDKRVLYADEGAGATNGEQFPVLNAASTAHISGHTIRDIMVGGNTGAAAPVVFSTTPNVRSCTYSNIVMQGTNPEFLVQFLNVPSGDRLNTNSIIGPITGSELAVEGNPAPRASNAAGFAHVIDPQGFFASTAGNPGQNPAGTPVRYLSLARTPVAPFKASGNLTLAPVADSLGGTDAVEATFTASGSLQVSIANAATIIRPGEPVWVEFDARAGSLTALRARIEQSGGVFHYQRIHRLGPNWHRFRFLWTPRAITAGMHLMLLPINNELGTFEVGRVRIYHSMEPLNVDGLTVIGGVVHRLAVTDGAVTAVAV